MRDGVFAELRPLGSVTVIGRQAGSPITALALQARSWLCEPAEEWLSADQAALLNGVVLGADSGALERETVEAFRAAGMTHILVASGTQVALVASAVVWFGRRRRWSRRYAAAIAIGSAWVYAVVAGLQAPLVRAAATAAIVLAGNLGEREAQPVNSLALSAALWLLYRPLDLHSASFLYTYAAAWGVVVPGAGLRRAALAAARGHGVPVDPPAPLEPRRPLAWMNLVLVEAIATTFGVAMALAPFTASLSAQVTPAELVTNLLAIPLAQLALVAGLPGVILAHLPGLGGPVCAALGLVIDLLRATADLGAALPGGQLAVFPPPIACCVPWLVAAAALGWLLERRWSIGNLAALGAAALFAGGCLWPASAEGRVRVAFLDVGQGDSILVQGPEGGALLQDAGRAGEGAVALRALRALRVARLELLVITHPDDDHAGGAATILHGVAVGALVVPHTHPDAGGFGRALEAAASEGVPIIVASRGARWLVGGATVTALGPPPQPITDAASRDNENGVALSIRAGAFGAVLPGDAGFAGEESMLASGYVAHTSVLAAGHHGSAGSTGDAWLQTLRPQLTVVSCGKRNAYGHPAPEALDRIAAVRSQVARTDRDGAVLIAGDVDGSFRASGWLSHRELQQSRSGPATTEESGAY
jgi:competence protein ComEC